MHTQDSVLGRLYKGISSENEKERLRKINEMTNGQFGNEKLTDGKYKTPKENQFSGVIVEEGAKIC